MYIRLPSEADMFDNAIILNNNVNNAENVDQSAKINTTKGNTNKAAKINRAENKMWENIY